MSLYHACVCLHLLAAFLWIGHMVFWSVVVGPLLKRIEPAAVQSDLRVLCLRHGGLGWPALAVLVVTGAYMLRARGVAFSHLISADLWSYAEGRVLGTKLTLVLGMILYQWFVGHRPAPRLIYLNILAALTILALSVVLVRPLGM